MESGLIISRNGVASKNHSCKLGNQPELPEMAAVFPHGLKQRQRS